MDMDAFATKLEQLRACNDCEVAADMDVDDAKHALSFAIRKLRATRERRNEVREHTQVVMDQLADMVNEACAPSLFEENQ